MKLTANEPIAVGSKTVVGADGYLYQNGTKVTPAASVINSALFGANATAAELNYLDVSANGAATRYIKAALAIAADTDPHDTAIVIPDGSIIKNVWVVVTTQEATGTVKTVDIGVSSGDEDGFLDGVSVAAAGTIKGTLLNTGQTLGALLRVDEDGSAGLVPEPYVCSADTTICYTLGAANFAELVANVIVEYVYIP